MSQGHDQFDLFEIHARSTDPWTSHEAVDDLAISRQCAQLLPAYRDGYPLTDYDAYRLAGFPNWRETTHRRCSDLRNQKLICFTGGYAISPMGKKVKLSQITPAGLRFLRRKPLE